MEGGLNKDKPEVRLRAFRAIDDPKSCELFVQGHAQVLTNIGITKLTSSNNNWTTNKAAFVMIVESLDKEKIYGGVRLHVAGGNEPLPIEQATGMLDPDVYDLVREYARYGTGEVCGLWNSREIAGYGVGSIFLSRVCVAISTQVGIQSLFALCAPYTVKMGENLGYTIEESIGNKGTFFYPKLDLVATTMLLKDPEILSTAREEDRASIFKLRDNLNTIQVEKLRDKEIDIHYEIEIPNLDQWSLCETIANAGKSFTREDVNETALNFL
ncbi:MAG: hypothetical protein ABIN89_22690 [Chitinophagaceae bacterium]